MPAAFDLGLRKRPPPPGAAFAALAASISDSEIGEGGKTDVVADSVRDRTLADFVARSRAA